MAFQGQIDRLMGETETRLRLLLEAIAPWDERRKTYPPDLAAEVDRFLELLEKGLTGIQTRLGHRVEDIESRLAKMRENMDSLSQKREGVQGYRQPNTRLKGFDKKA